jgi:hypothetical protein
MKINTQGPGPLPDLTDDQLIEEFYTRLYDNPAFSARISKILLPYNMATTPPTRSRLVELVVERHPGQRHNNDNIYEHQGYELLNKVT